MKTKKTKPNEVALNVSEKKEKLLSELIEQAKKKGTITSMPKLWNTKK